MAVSGIEGTGGPGGRGLNDLASQKQEEATFQSMLQIDPSDYAEGDAGPHRRSPPPPGGASASGGRAEDVRPHGHEGQGGDTDRAANLRQQATELREEAGLLREKAENVEEFGEDLHMGQVYLHRAIALEQRADSKEQEAATVEARQRDVDSDRTLNGGGGVGDLPEPRPVDVDPVEGWAPADQVAEYEAEINAISGFEEADVVSSREATENEVDAFIEQAVEAGIEDIEFVEGYLHAFPIQFVYVENLEALGMETATGGELMFDNKTIILMDGDYASDDTTTDVSPDAPAAQSAMAFSFFEIIDTMIEMKAVELATAPNPIMLASLDDDALDNGATEADAVAPLGNAATTVGLSGVTDFDGDPDE